MQRNIFSTKQLLYLKNFLKASTIFTLLYPMPLRAQVVPDNTIPNNSQVSINGNVLVVNQGTTVGNNLFHSFRRFSVQQGQKVLINNSLSIESILARVNGTVSSNIDGTIATNGTANLFFINPNGITFGPNSKLDIGGSFLATTANSVKFLDGSEYTAVGSNNNSLLTISTPIGLQFGVNPKPIRVNNLGHDLAINDSIFSTLQRSDRQSGLQIKPRKTLALIGGDLKLSGALISSEGGRIELGSVNSGFISFDNVSTGWVFNYSQISSFSDILLSQKSLLDVSGNQGGSVNIIGSQISLSQGSVVLNQNRGNLISGNINLTASDFLTLDGTSSDKRIRTQLNTQTLKSGKGGDIFINTSKLFLKDGARIDTVSGTFPVNNETTGLGGQIIINANDLVRLSGISATNIITNPFYTSQVIARTQGSGTAGNISIYAKNLSLLDGSNVVSAANLGLGKGGDVYVSVTDSVKLIGINPFNFFSSAIGATSVLGGDAGNLRLDTKKLLLEDGGRIDSSTFGNSNAGNITVNSSESIEVTGTVPGSVNPSLIISSANLVDSPIARVFGLDPSILAGNSGSVTLKTKHLLIQNGGQVSVRNDGSGNAGNLNVKTSSLILRNKGSISASTLLGNGGSIDLDVLNLLLLRNNSLISTDASEFGNAGNISINSKLVVSSPFENSDIIANAQNGKGGKISITTKGLIGLEVRNKLTDFSDITAFSSNSPEFNGIIVINSPEVDPSERLTEFKDAVEPPKEISQGCRSGQTIGSSSFVNLGRGGLPTTPYEDQTSTNVWHDLRANKLQSPTASSVSPSLPVVTHTTPSIQEAKGWIKDSQDRVYLTAKMNQPIDSSLTPTTTCSPKTSN